VEECVCEKMRVCDLVPEAGEEKVAPPREDLQFDSYECHADSMHTETQIKHMHMQTYMRAERNLHV